MDSGDEQLDKEKPIEDSSSGFIIFRCSDNNCLKWYRSFGRCEDHIISGRHAYAEEKHTLLDTAVQIYQIKCDKLVIDCHPQATPNLTGDSKASVFSSLVQGWALVQPKAIKRFSQEQISFLTEKYDEGEKTGSKWNPSAVALVKIYFSQFDNVCVLFQAMRSAQVAGKMRFSPEDHLTSSQVKTYFSKLTSLRRQQSQNSRNSSRQDQPNDLPTNDGISIDNDEADDDDDYLALIEDARRQQLRVEVYDILGPNSLWTPTTNNQA